MHTMSPQIEQALRKQRWFVPIFFSLVAFFLWNDLVCAALYDLNLRVHAPRFILCCAVTAVSFLFVSAKRYEYRIETAFLGCGSMLAGFGYIITSPATALISAASGVSIVTGSTLAVFIRALEEKRLPRRLSWQKIGVALTRSITATVFVVLGDLLLLGLFALTVGILMGGVNLFESLLALFCLVCGFVFYLVLVHGVLWEFSFIGDFWGKWVSRFLPTKKLVLGSALVTIPLGLCIVALAKIGYGDRLILLTTMVAEATVVCGLVVIKKALLKRRGAT